MTTYTAYISSGVTYYSTSGASGGTTVLPTLQSGDLLYVDSGAVASGVQVVSGGIAEIYVSGGGELLSSTINSSYLYVSSGGIVSGSTINAPSGELYAGGSAVNNVYGGAEGWYIAAGATVSGATINSGTILDVLGSATLAAITVNSGGTLNDVSGDTISGLTVNGGASFTNPAGATISNLVVNSGGNVVNNGTLSGAAVSSGAVLSNGGTATAVSVLSGGAYQAPSLAASSFAGVTISSGAAIGEVGDGTTWNAVSSGGTTVYNWSSAGTSGTLPAGASPFLSDADTLNISSGAVASGVRVVSGGVASIYVLNGGELLSSTVNTSDLYVSSGGVTSGNTINVPAGEIFPGGSSVNDVLSGADTLYVSSGTTVIGVTVDSGATLDILGSATLANITVNSGGTVDDVSGDVVSGMTVNNGGSFTNPAGATVSGLVVNSGGNFANNGTLASAVVSSGATLSNNGAATNVSVLSGGAYKGSSLQPSALSGITVASGAAVGEIYGGTTWNAVSSGGTTVYNWSSGGTSGTLPPGVSPDLSDGDTLNVSSGAVASGVQVASAGIAIIYVSNGGELLSSHINHSYLYVSSGGVTSGNTQNSPYGEFYEGGSSVNDVYDVQYGDGANTIFVASGAGVSGGTVSSGMTLDVFSGATLSNITVGSGGTLTDAYGNTIDGLTVGSGASFTNAAGDTVSGLVVQSGGSFVNDGSFTGGIDFSGSNDSVTLTSATNLPTGPISGFFQHNTLAIDGLTLAAPVETVTIGSNGVVAIPTGSGFVDLTFAGVPAGSVFTISDAGGVATISDNAPPCFCAGTNIRTPDGDKSVETIQIGDLVLTAEGLAVPVRWVGTRLVATRFAGYFHSIPVRIRAGALGENLPERDLLVSPDHAMFIDGILAQAGALVNGTSIIRDANMPETFTYYHLELPEHAIILAEGAATETFVDNASRMAFDNWDEHEALHGDTRIMELTYPRAKSARQIPGSLRLALAERAEAQGLTAISA